MSRSNQGFEFQRRITRSILRRFRDWDSIVIIDGRGRVITDAEDVPLTRDGGIDVCVRVRTDLPARTQKAIETRVRKILANEPF